MQTRSIILFGAQGYVGGSIAAEAMARKKILVEVHSSQFPFWDDVRTWPMRLVQTPADVAILAASFEKPIVEGDEALLPTLCERFEALLERLLARRILFLSTDGVFDGQHPPYREPDTRSPLTPYGRCKAAMEAVAAKWANVHVVRMSVVWGAGVTRPDKRRQYFLENREKGIRGAINARRCPIEVSRLARAVVRLADEDKLPPILHLATPSMTYFSFIQTCLLPEAAERVSPWIDPTRKEHDTTLATNHPDLVSRLLA